MFSEEDAEHLSIVELARLHYCICASLFLCFHTKDAGMKFEIGMHELFFFLCVFLKPVFILLQSGKKVTSNPNPQVQFTVGHKSFESKVRPKHDPC